MVTRCDALSRYLENPRQAAFKVSQHVVVPKAQDQQAAGLQCSRPGGVAFLGMLAAIHLDH